MNCQGVIKRLIVVFSFCMAAAVQAAQPEIKAVTPPQPGGSAGQIEVLEFFSYGCPHCYNLDPHLRKWESAQKKDVVLKRIPVSFGRPAWAALGRVYTTLEAMKLTEKYNSAVFEAVQKGQVRLDDEKTRNEWLAKIGVDVKAFNDTWRSFGVESLTKRYEQLAISYKIDAVPSLSVNGAFKVVGEDEDTLKAVDSLVAKVRSGK